MSDLVFIAFDNEKQAEEVRDKVLEMQREYLIEVDDAVVVVREQNGRVKLITSSCIRQPAERLPEPSGAC